MAIAPIKKVHLLAHEGLRETLLSSLQEEGLLQIEKVDAQGLDLKEPASEVSRIDHEIYRLDSALDYLSRWEDKGLLKRMFLSKPPLPRSKREDVLKEDFHGVLDTIEELERKRSELISHIRFLEREEEFLAPLEDLELPVRQVRATETVEVLLGTMPTPSLDDLLDLTREANLWAHIIHHGRRMIHLMLMYPKSEKEHLDPLLRQTGVSPLYFTEPMLERAGPEDKVIDVIAKLRQERVSCQDKLKALDAEGRRLAGHRETLMRVHDVLWNEREKLLSSGFLGETERTIYLEAWIRAADIPRLESKLSPFSDLVQCYVRPPLPDEEPPIVLENPKVGKPFELVTKLYGLPLKGTFDPTLPLAPFFFLFVGITVSEAGYGALVALLSFLFLRLAKPKGGLRQFLTLLGILGVATVIMGTLVGGWFGFPLRKLMVLDPLKDPLAFLILSLVLGFIQVWFGTLLNMLSAFKRRDYLQAVFVQGGWLLLLPSLVLYALRKQPVWGILAVVGASGIVLFAAPSRNPIARFFGGLYSLYDISRYLADVLSYSRLLALGLATSVIAMVVNTLSQTALGIPWLGWLFAALIFVGGHLFNLGISFLGGFVHSMRLQFVEFFSKFFRSGGKPFKPFALEGKYVEFT
ncbi:MAG: V-type ATP synthase subunit I [Candidatus Aminicenantales bacterium]